MRRKPTGLLELRQQIFRAREAAGISQAELGRRLGRDRQTVYRWEAGDREPSATDLGALARALGVSADHLLGLAE